MARRTDNLEEFVAGVRAFSGVLVPKLAVQFHKKVSLEALRRVVLKTPVDTGRARGGWLLEVGEIPRGEGGLDDSVEDNGDTITAGLTQLAGLPPYSVVYLANNVAYIVFLEEGSSQQAPQGMLAVTVEELNTIIFGVGATAA